MKPQAEHKDSGLTLVELMVAMVVALIVAGAIYSVYVTQTHARVVHEINLELQEGLRAALNIMEREIRTAGANPERITSDPPRIITANANELHFTRDIDDDARSGRFNGEISQPNEDIRYELDGTDLIRETALPTIQRSVLLDNVAILNFVYLGRDGQPTNNIEEIRSVTVTIVAESGQSDRGFLTRYTDDKSYVNPWTGVF